MSAQSMLYISLSTQHHSMHRYIYSFVISLALAVVCPDTRGRPGHWHRTDAVCYLSLSLCLTQYMSSNHPCSGWRLSNIGVHRTHSIIITAHSSNRAKYTTNKICSVRDSVSVCGCVCVQSRTQISISLTPISLAHTFCSHWCQRSAAGEYKFAIFADGKRWSLADSPPFGLWLVSGYALVSHTKRAQQQAVTVRGGWVCGWCVYYICICVYALMLHEDDFRWMMMMMVLRFSYDFFVVVMFNQNRANKRRVFCVRRFLVCD